MNPETHECPTCGYVWKHGEHGGHNCSDLLLEKIEKMKTAIKDLNKVVHDQVVVMQSAIIDASNNGPEKGLKWIYNQLWQPGCLPDENDEWINDAQLYYNAHRSDPLGPCEICEKPSACSGQGHVACSLDHLDQAIGR